MSVWTLLGGPVFWLLAVLGAASAVLFFVRIMGLRRAQIDRSDFMRGVVNLIEKGNPDEALAVCDETSAPVARVVAAAIQRRKSTARALREAVDIAGRAEVGRLDRRMAALAIVAQSAPLLGLLGTIIGMTRVMIAVEGPELVSRTVMIGGALQTLAAAAAGIVVAVSVQVMYGLLRVRLDRLTADLEAAASEILAVIAAARENAA